MSNGVSWSIHSREGTRPRVAILATAHDDARTFERLGPGQGSVSVARNDIQIDLDKLRLDFLLVCESARTAPWVGVITNLREALDGIVHISAEGLPVLLDGEPMPQAATYNASTGSGVIARAILRNANGGEHTGISPGSITPGPSLAGFDLGGQTGLQALNDLAEKTGLEWSARYAVSPARVDAFLDWQDRQGADLSARAYLYEGRDFVEFEYGLDLASMVAAITTLGGTGPITDRPAGSSAARERTLRALRRFRVGTHRRVNQDTTTPTQGDLIRSSSAEQERAISAAENLVAVVNTSSDWHDHEVGNYETFAFNTSLSGNAARVMRILGVQPMEAEGLCALTLEGALR